MSFTKLVICYSHHVINCDMLINDNMDEINYCRSNTDHLRLNSLYSLKCFNSFITIRSEMWLQYLQRLFIILAFLLCDLSVHALDDPISQLARIRSNYTMYEENLWTQQYQNTSIEQIYEVHSAFINHINKVFDKSDNTINFYPIWNGSLHSLKNTPIIDALLINPYHVPVINDIVISNAKVNDLWSKFSNWPTHNASLDVLSDDAIPILQTSLNTFCNITNTAVYFDFLNNVRYVFFFWLEFCVYCF